ncbi:MAG: response regulator [Elusimicrobia bacterium]|nr:response regulator [Elusimicrobiota bacterium]
MKRILAVDDDPALTEYYKALLQEAGYEVLIAPDATAAMMIFLELKPHLVILDAEMPGGGGEQVFMITREILKSGVPVIFVTGLPERVEPFLRAHGRVRLFKKPVRSEELLSCVSEMLSFLG